MTAVERLHSIVELAVAMNNEAEAAREDFSACSKDRLQIGFRDGQGLRVLLDWCKANDLKFSVETGIVNDHDYTEVSTRYNGIYVLVFADRLLTAEENELIGRYKNHEKV